MENQKKEIIKRVQVIKATKQIQVTYGNVTSSVNFFTHNPTEVNIT